MHFGTVFELLKSAYSLGGKSSGVDDFVLSMKDIGSICKEILFIRFT